VPAANTIFHPISNEDRRVEIHQPRRPVLKLGANAQRLAHASSSIRTVHIGTTLFQVLISRRVLETYGERRRCGYIFVHSFAHDMGKFTFGQSVVLRCARQGNKRRYSIYVGALRHQLANVLRGIKVGRRVNEGGLGVHGIREPWDEKAFSKDALNRSIISCRAIVHSSVATLADHRQHSVVGDVRNVDTFSTQAAKIEAEYVTSGSNRARSPAFAPSKAVKTTTRPARRSKPFQESGNQWTRS